MNGNVREYRKAPENKPLQAQKFPALVVRISTGAKDG
jgi:hypothetical protein